MKNFNQLLKEASQKGFSLIELIIVIAVISLLVTLVGGNVLSKFDQAKVDSTRIQINQMGTSLDQYRLDCGYYPTTEEGLDALVDAPATGSCKNYDPEGYVKGRKLPKDAWNNDFLYESDGSSYRVTSLGKDGKEGGESHEADIHSDGDQQ